MNFTQQTSIRNIHIKRFYIENVTLTQTYSNNDRILIDLRILCNRRKYITELNSPAQGVGR